MPARASNIKYRSNEILMFAKALEGNIKDVTLQRLCSFSLTLFITPLTHPPLPFEHLVDFLTDWEALCTTLRLDNIRHRSEETMSNIP